MNKLTAFKLVARIVVGAGTTTVTNSIIRNNVAPSNAIEQISVGIASLVIGSMASEATRSHTDTQIDAVVAAWNKTKSTDSPITA